MGAAKHIAVKHSAPPTLAAFRESDAFVRCVVGPVGSGKSSACVTEILKRAIEQAPFDGVRRTRFAVIRNTYRELEDTTRKTFEQWIPAALGKWHEQGFTFTMDFKLQSDGTKVECEVLFRALDRPEDIKKLLSLELTGAYVNEAREIPKHVLDVLQARVGRYPSKAQGGATWFGVWADTNPWHGGHWGAKLFKRGLPGHSLFRQPGGRSPQAENIENLPDGYYERLTHGKDREWVKVYVDGQDASGDVGSIWGPHIADLEARGGIMEFSYPRTGFFTSWDLGKADSTAIWFWRLNSNGVADVVDHYENHGKGLKHYFEAVESKGFEYVKHWLPHDAGQETLATEVSVFDQCLARWPGKVAIGPRMGVDDGIAATRWHLEQPMRIHPRCNEQGEHGYSGLDALREYRFEWDENTQSFSKTPLHNWASHSADAFRYLALVVKHSELMTRERKPPPAPHPARSLNSFTLEELFEANEEAR